MRRGRPFNLGFPGGRGDILRRGIRASAHGIRFDRSDLAGPRKSQFRCRNTTWPDQRPRFQRSPRRNDIRLSAAPNGRHGSPTQVTAAMGAQHDFSKNLGGLFNSCSEVLGQQCSSPPFWSACFVVAQQTSAGRGLAGPFSANRGHRPGHSSIPTMTKVTISKCSLMCDNASCPN